MLIGVSCHDTVPLCLYLPWVCYVVLLCQEIGLYCLNGNAWGVLYCSIADPLILRMQVGVSKSYLASSLVVSAKAQIALSLSKICCFKLWISSPAVFLAFSWSAEEKNNKEKHVIPEWDFPFLKHYKLVILGGKEIKALSIIEAQICYWQQLPFLNAEWYQLK